MPQDDKKIQLFENVPVTKAIMTLAIPSILSALVMVLYNLADTYFVSILGDPIQSAAVTLAAPVLLAFNAVNNLFGVGGSSMMSRAMGRRDYDTVSRSSAFSFYCALFASLLFSFLCTVFSGPLLTLLGADPSTDAATAAYMYWTVTWGAAPAILNVVLAQLVRAEGSSLHASIGTMSGCFLNILLDPLFILPQFLNMGAAGAGLATFLSNCVACLYFLVLLFVRRGKTFVCVNPKMFCFRRSIALGVFGVGLPAAIQNLLNVTSMTILNNFAAAYGADAVAAMGITKKIDMVPVNVAMGLSQGIMPLVSYNYASGNIKRAKDSVITAAKGAVSFLVVMAAVYYFGSGTIIGLFMKNEAIVAHGTRFLRAMCLGLPFHSIDFLAVGVFQAVGLGKNALIFALSRKVALEIPLTFLLNWLIPLYGLPYAQTVTEVIMAAMAVIFLTRLFRKLEKQFAQEALEMDPSQE